MKYSVLLRRFAIMGIAGFVFSMIGVYFPSMVFAQALEPNTAEYQAEVKQRFFNRLSDEHKVEYLRHVESEGQYTSAQLGTRYRWGYIPPDRTAPISLAQWWESLNARRKRQERLEWFDNHYQELDEERAARFLDDEEKDVMRMLFDIEDRVEKGKEYEGIKFENVPFPDSDTGIIKSQPDDAPSSPGRQPKPSDDAVRSGGSQSTQTSRESEDNQGPEPRATKPDQEQRLNTDGADQSTDQDNQKTAPDTDLVTDTETRPSQAVQPDQMEDTRSIEYESGKLIFETSGGHTRVIRRSDSTKNIEDFSGSEEKRRRLNIADPHLRRMQDRTGDTVPTTTNNETGATSVPELRF